jgi:mannitol/fructose-specific phosphotransferase system IIA component
MTEIAELKQRIDNHIGRTDKCVFPIVVVQREELQTLRALVVSIEEENAALRNFRVKSVNETEENNG